MTSAKSQARLPFGATNDFVSSDFIALASHMHACNRSRGRFFKLRTMLESVHALVSPRVVTTGAVFAVFGLGLLAFA
jgi:hypothetical protein